MRDGDTVARLGGDEFVILADGSAADAQDLAVRLRNEIIQPSGRGAGRAVGASFGIGGRTADGRRTKC
ncbi:hypothetical protein GCM10023238_29370 [Streptomyces heliomycini]